MLKMAIDLYFANNSIFSTHSQQVGHKMGKDLKT